MKTLMERLKESVEEQRLFEQERAILEVTELVSRLMEEQNVSKAELARRLSTSKANVTQMLDGRRNMTVRTLADVLFSLGRALRASTQALACEEDDSQEIVWTFHAAEPKHWESAFENKRNAAAPRTYADKMAG